MSTEPKEVKPADKVSVYRVTPKGKNDFDGWDAICCAGCAAVEATEGYALTPLCEIDKPCAFQRIELHGPITTTPPPAKTIEQLAGELANVIINADKVKYYDTRLQSDERIKRLLIEFAQEVKRSAIEP